MVFRIEPHNLYIFGFVAGADDISEVHVNVQQTNQSLGIVRIEWEEPVNPNGFVVTYTLKCMRVDFESVRIKFVFYLYLSLLYNTFIIKCNGILFNRLFILRIVLQDSNI